MEHPKLPPKVAAGIANVIGAVSKIGKTENNQHGRYKYVSVDAFYAQIGPLMGAQGIFVNIDQEDVEIFSSGEKGTTYAKIRYVISIAHASGECWEAGHRTLILPANGPQAFGAAESYVLKYYLRSLFLVPTGEPDADADSMPSDPLPKTPPKPDRAEVAARAFAVQVTEAMKDEAANEIFLTDINTVKRIDKLISHYSKLPEVATMALALETDKK